MTLLKKPVLVLLILTFALATQAQRRVKQIDDEQRDKDEKAKSYEQTSFWDKVHFGGSFGGSIGSGFGGSSTSLLLQPIAAYEVNENFYTGLGFTYLYWSQKFDFSTGPQTYSDNAFGLNIFARHRVYGPVFVHAEYMPMNFTAFNGYGESKRVWGNAVYLGGGLQERNFYALVLYNVLWRSPNYTDPADFSNTFSPTPFDVRIGFLF